MRKKHGARKYIVTAMVGLALAMAFGDVTAPTVTSPKARAREAARNSRLSGSSRSWPAASRGQSYQVESPTSTAAATQGVRWARGDRDWST